MAYQFAHIESFSRSGGKTGKLTIAQVIAEAKRTPESCLHVLQPKPPVKIWGCDLDMLTQRHDDLVCSAKEILTNGKERAIRKDTPSLFTCVLSHPATPEECHRDPMVRSAVEAWAKDSINWLRKELESKGGSLECAIMHIDESHVHLHTYGLHPSGHADRLHPGKVAKKDSVAAALQTGDDKQTANRIGDKAYVGAMRAWQDSYSQDVGLPHGLTRLGPSRRRLSRAEWHLEKAAAKAVNKARDMERAAMEGAKAAEAERQHILEKAKQNSMAITGEAAVRMNQATRAEQKAKNRTDQIDILIRSAQQERAQILASAHKRARLMKSIGGMLRTLWDALRISSIRRNLQTELQPVLAREKEHAAIAVQRLQEEVRRRIETEQRLLEANRSAQNLGLDRDRLRQERDRLLEKSSAPVVANSPKFP